LPLIRETLNQIFCAKYYTKLNIIAAFNKIRIAKGHEWKTAFITRFGLFETVVMPFSLCNTLANFQNYINQLLWNIFNKYCIAYFDDIFIYSNSRAEHHEYVREMVKRLLDAKLQINIGKCEFEAIKTKYLGIMVTPEGIEMNPAKIQFILEWETPTLLQELQKFLKFANFYRRFIKGFSTVTKPFHDLLKKGQSWK
jgi:hypothetical protein